MGEASATPGAGPITYEEFLDRYEGHAEWVDGEVEMMAAASSKHQRLGLFLASVLKSLVEQRELGEVFIAPFQMKTGLELPGREPDLLFVAREHLDRVKQNHLAGPADLVIEIVSPESILRDRGAKLAEYERGGVCEYWILDPDEEQADFHILTRAGHFERRGFEASGVFHSTVVEGFWFRQSWLCVTKLPRTLEALRELGII